MKSLLKEYCLKSSVHGLHYVVASRRPLYERTIWFLLLAVATILLIQSLWESWEAVYSGPVQVIVNNPRYELYKLDFPAVTICSNNKALKNKAEAHIWKTFGNSSDEEVILAYKNALKAFSMMRFPFYNHPYTYVFEMNNTAYHIPNDRIWSIMKEISPSIEDMMLNCYWRGNRVNCSDIFRTQITEEGFCYSFNSRTADRTNNYSAINPPFRGADGNLYALRSHTGGKTTGLCVFLNSLNNEFLSGDLVTPGYSVMVHSPNDYPDVSQNVILSGLKKNEYGLSVSVSTTQADTSLLRLEESIRGCYFVEGIVSDEGNCYLWCRIRTIYSYCNCVPYYLKHFIEKAEICGLQHFRCISLINVRLRNINMTKDMPGFPTWSLPLTMNCTCNEPCSYVSYSSEAHSQKSYSAKMLKSSFDNVDNYYMFVDVSYKDNWAISYSRQAKFGMRDFIVTVGGMAGLLLGCSLVSIVEIFYYLIRYLAEQWDVCRGKQPNNCIIHVYPFVN